MHPVHENSQNRILVLGLLIQHGSENHEIIRACDWIQRKMGHRTVQGREDVTEEFILDVMKLLSQNQSHYFT